MVARARAAQPGWEALGFEGRGRILLRAQKWLIDNADRVIRTIVSETGKTYEDAQLAELSYGASSFGFWAKKAPEFLADEKVSTSPRPFYHRRLVLVGDDTPRTAEVLQGGSIQLAASLVGDYGPTAQDGDVLEHFLAAVTESRCFDGECMERTAELVHHEGCERVAVHASAMIDELLLPLCSSFRGREEFWMAADLLIGDQEVGPS